MVTRLDGDDWQLRGCLGSEWERQVAADKPWDAPGWLPARVPGSVVDDGPGWLTFDDNVLDLLPGETRTIALHGDGELVVSGWNVEEIRVPA